uniref:C-type lectin domain-containing protein n=1 Tax=Poecilia formosa TaxID=48698 RepID=A0A087X7L5_POEFO
KTIVLILFSHYFHVSTFLVRKKTWTEAQQYCREKHTDLVTVTNMKDMKRLINISAGEMKEAWIGLNDPINGIRTWRWSLPGVEFNESETNWNPGEPWDRWISNCGILGWNARWFNAYCTYQSFFLCYDGKIELQVNYFHYINENKTWTEAQQYCREKHTDLVTVTNMKDMKRLINISAGDQSEAWIGLYNQTNGTRTWCWSLPGVEFNESETNWMSGEPSDGGNQTSENCEFLYENLKWVDTGCHHGRFFFCYDESNSQKYHLIRQKKSWTEAQHYCREKHTDLVTVTNMKDMKRLIRNSNGEMKEAWIRLYDQTHGTRTWYWSLSRVEFNENEAKQHKGEPRCYCHPKRCSSRYPKWYLNCGILWWPNKWCYVRCRERFYFLCYDETNTTHKYYLIKEVNTWQEAQIYCRQNHTDLISGTKQLQDEEVEKLMNSTCSLPPFIGLFRDTWRWSDENSSSFRHWNKDFNNDIINSGQCAMTVFDDGGSWKNENCNKKKPFICYDAQCCFMDCQLYQFHYINENKTWTEAQQYCREKHTDLVTVTNMKDMKRLINISAGSKNRAWIGLHYQTHGTRTWYWSLPGVEFDVSETNWMSGEPTDKHRNEISGNCGFLFKSFTWADESCHHVEFFLCYDGEETDRNQKYHLIEDKKTWQKAQIYCRENHTDMISGTKQIQDARSANVLNSVGNKTHIHFGLFRDAWKWSDGSSFSFRYWHKGFNNQQPNSGQCAMFKFNDKGRWRNENCMAKKHFICYDVYVFSCQFHYINENKTWTEAQQYCREKHTDLVTVTNMKDMKRLINISAGSKNRAWIGLHYQTHGTRTWYWSLPGVEFDVSETNWMSGEPTDKHRNEISGNCGFLFKSFTWADESCHHVEFFLCYDGEETDRNQKYHLIEDKKTWQKAQIYCRENHTDMISGTKQIQDARSANVLNSVGNKTHIHFGLFRDAWKWSDGSSFSFRYWHKGFNNQQPNSGQCAMFKFNDKGRWRNENCMAKKHFICYD